MNKKLIIFDLDNTIYDWYNSFIPAFYGMIEEASSILGCSSGDLIREIRDVHVLHGDVEHPFSVLETKIVQDFLNRYGRQRAEELLDPAFHEFNKIRKANLRLFPDVMQTLNQIRQNNIKVVAHTDAKFFGALGRLLRLGVIDYFDCIYCRERDVSFAPEKYTKVDTTAAYLYKVVELPRYETKPNSRILERIISNHQESNFSTAYIGDSLSKDMLMAKNVGCSAVWAKYGSNIDSMMFERLVNISHWTAEDIENERLYREKSKSLKPDFVCENCISEVLEFLWNTRD